MFPIILGLAIFKHNSAHTGFFLVMLSSKVCLRLNPNPIDEALLKNQNLRKFEV